MIEVSQELYDYLLRSHKLGEKQLLRTMLLEDRLMIYLQPISDWTAIPGGGVTGDYEVVAPKKEELK
jgi:hypothetical protein